MDKIKKGIRHARNQLSFSKCRYIVNNNYNPTLNNTRRKCKKRNQNMEEAKQKRINDIERKKNFATESEKQYTTRLTKLTANITKKQRNVRNLETKKRQLSKYLPDTTCILYNRQTKNHANYYKPIWINRNECKNTPCYTMSGLYKNEKIWNMSREDCIRQKSENNSKQILQNQRLAQNRERNIQMNKNYGPCYTMVYKEDSHLDNPSESQERKYKNYPRCQKEKEEYEAEQKRLDNERKYRLTHRTSRST